MMRRFVLQRDEDPTGVSGTGVVAEGVIFSSGKAVLEWLTDWPTSVVWHERGMESVEHIHGHDGRTRVVFLDPLTVPDENALLRLIIRKLADAHVANLDETTVSDGAGYHSVGLTYREAELFEAIASEEASHDHRPAR